MTVYEDVKSVDVFKSAILNFTATLKGVMALLELEDEDDYGVLKPTQYAYKTAMRLILEAYEIMGLDFPMASAGTDEQGGINLDWSKREADRKVILFCPSNPEKKVFVFHHLGEEYGRDDMVSVSTLVHWLHWLNEV